MRCPTSTSSTFATCARVRAARPDSREAAVAATKAAIGLWHRLLALFSGLLGGLLGIAGSARAVDLPENKAEALFHAYSGGGVNAYGPAFLVRKSIFDKVALTGTY